jgi:hypothetical protein
LEELYTVSKVEYLSQFIKLSREEFCSQDSPFQKCFSFTEEKCYRLIEASIERCKKRMVIPSKINYVLNGENLALKLGQCAGQEFYLNNKKGLAKLPICSRRDSWQ